MTDRTDYENRFDLDDEPHKWIYDAVKNNDTGSIHFGPDPRFISSMDQTRWCFVLFNNWIRCAEKLGEDAPRCQYLHHKYRSVTPIAMQDKWQEELDDGKFPGYQPGYEPQPVVVDYSIRPSRNKHKDEHD